MTLIHCKTDFQPKNPFKAVFWDIDGTLVATEHLQRLSYSLVLEECNIYPTKDDWHTIHHETTKHIVEIFKNRYPHFPMDEQEFRERKMFHHEKLYDQFEVVFPSIRDILSMIKNRGLHQAAVTNSTPHAANLSLGFIGHEYFDFCVTSDDVERSKPKPDSYLKAMNQLKLQPKDCLVIEDSYIGVTAGLAAGMTVIACPSDLSDYNEYKDIFHKSHIVTNTIETLDWPLILGL